MQAKFKLLRVYCYDGKSIASVLIGDRIKRHWRGGVTVYLDKEPVGFVPKGYLVTSEVLEPESKVE